MKSRLIQRVIALWGFAAAGVGMWAEEPLRILSFNGDTGFVHDSKALAEQMIVELGEKNGWVVSTDADPNVFLEPGIESVDVVVFSNNCGTESAIFNERQQAAFQKYIRDGGGYVGIHCAGAIWHETGEFRGWYERLVGTKLIAHPHVQPARLHVERRDHVSTLHLPNRWDLTDEWHQFNENPRRNVNVLISLDESSYKGKEKMNGDHPVSWFQHFDGGRSFFTTLGHTREMYGNADYRTHIEGAIRWAAGAADSLSFEPIQSSLQIDLNADFGVALEDGNRVAKWSNQVASSAARDFVKRDAGRLVPGSGRPRLRLDAPEIRGHNALVFNRQELVNHEEDAFDHLLTGSGYTWFAVMAVYTQVPGLKDVSSFFGNLKNGGNFEGIWGCLTDDNRPWMGSRSGKTFGRWDENNPMVVASDPLEEGRFYLLMGRMAHGTGEVPIELFVNDPTSPVATGVYPVHWASNASKFVIGQERDATNHPGEESFDGEISRFLLYDRPLSDAEMGEMAERLRTDYAIQP